ncbi:insulinase family protein [Endothiovibrio diazotrophicus]
MSDVHPAFELLRSEPISSLHLTLEEYRHTATGARHLHLASDDGHNAFMVAFRTVPEDSTGVAHILEHTSLCGSKRYPVRDPFFMMTRRSLNTFMNAFTGADWTAYPFASQNRKDFDNLLRVYLDAVFFPNLDELDFAQEGHRVEFEPADDANGQLVFKGVVFNEMKGAMSNPVSTLWQTLSAELYPTVTYHHNSGGDPHHIPDLTYQQLRDFHRTHYHPSNALFLTYGDIPAADHQARFQALALEGFARDDHDFTIPDERRFDAPRSVEATYALDPAEETRAKTHIVLAWLLGRNDDMETVLKAHLLTGVLLDNSASPLRRALETSKLGTSPSPLCGLDDSPREMSFSCGLEGSEPQHAEAVERLVFEVLNDVAEKGAPKEMVEAVLHQLELSQREIGGGHFPYGLQLMLNAMTPAMHGGDPAHALEIDPVLKKLRADIEDPAFIPALVRELLLDNPHRVRLTLAPDTAQAEREAAAEAARLATIREGLSETEKRAIVERAAALEARQNRHDDPERLPKVGIEDVPAELKIARGEEHEQAGMPIAWYPQGTNGLVYQELVTELPELSDEETDLLPLLSSLMGEVGSGGRDYLETQALQAAVTGGIGVRTPIRGAVDDVQRVRGLFVVSGKALARNQRALGELIQETFESARFDELSRIRELIAQDRADLEQGVTGRGHSLAMSAAGAGMSPTAALSHRWSGLLGIRKLKALDDSLEDTDHLGALAARLAALRDKLAAAPRRMLVISEEEQQDAIAGTIEALWSDRPAHAAAAPFRLDAVEHRVMEAWTTSTQVNFAARAYPAVAAAHPDAPALLVLGNVLRNGFLHRAIREQGGAYGGGAGFDADSGAFRFYSYRDPRLEETLADFDASIGWLLERDHPWHTVEEAILGVVSRIDQPSSPAGEARIAYYNGLNGRTPEHRNRLRQGVLAVTEADLKRVAESYLKPERASTALVTASGNADKARALGLEIRAL